MNLKMFREACEVSTVISSNVPRKIFFVLRFRLCEDIIFAAALMKSWKLCCKEDASNQIV
jgi:hypothetical protein